MIILKNIKRVRLGVKLCLGLRLVFVLLIRSLVALGKCFG